MPRGNASRTGTGTVDSDVTEFLLEFAKGLIEAGIKHGRVAAMLQLAYFQAASDRAKFSNSRLNQSAVAAMTGLTRVQVRRFAKQNQSTQQDHRDGVKRVVEGWASDPNFRGVRKRGGLRLGGGPGTFTSLVRKYGGDIPSRSVLRELQRHRYVTVRGNYVFLRPAVRQSYGEIRLRRLSRILKEVVEARAHEGDGTLLRSMSLSTLYPATSEKGRLLLQRQTAESARVLLDQINAAGQAAALESPASRVTKARVTQTKLILISEDFVAE